MNKLKTSLLILMLLASISASAGYAPDSVQIALKKMYPTAAGIAWSQDKAYYVADFVMNGFDTRVWFTPDAEWVMKQTDWETLDEVPAAVFNAFAASDTERYMGAVSRMAAYRSHTGGQAEHADEISDIVYPERRSTSPTEYH